MSLPASDTFTRADAATLGSNWTLAIGTWSIVSNQAAPSTNGVNNLAFWNADSFSADQKSTLTLAGINVGGPAVRVDAVSGGNGYIAVCTTTIADLYKVINGTATLIQALPTSLTSGDVVRLEDQGSTLRVYKNNVQIGTDVTDNSLTSGSAGLWGQNNAGLYDDWIGDNISSAAGAIVFNLQVG